MTLMHIRQITSCPDHNRTIIVLEDVSQRLTLTLGADPAEARRLVQEIAPSRCTCHPVYDFILALLEAFQATATRVVLDDFKGEGIAGFIHFRRAEAEVSVACYAPDALALALRADVPIYATAEALAHAERLSPPSPRVPDQRGEVTQWLERVRPDDF